MYTLIDEVNSTSKKQKDRSGNIILSKLDEITLRKIALETDGKYFRATSGELELERIYGEIQAMEKKELKSREFNKFEEKFYFPGFFLLILLILELFVDERKRKSVLDRLFRNFKV